ncbi:CAP domain-containing protein [Mycobacterium colombiense]|uniref:CAP domain-containing protein n=1 Tax=Mycobacterium colombiense TaxID=339268 RepID=UPI000AA72108|nr:CAP domain-containing protein [Mycobacterium colombiense]
MAKKVEIIAVFAIFTAFITSPWTLSGFVAHADDSGSALYSGINQLRSGCGPISDDPRLTEAAQRHADDMLRNGVSGHIGSDGSSPQARITAAGYRSRYSGEIVFWGTGSAATPKEALDMWMQSPPHRDIILNCAYNAGGFATAWDGNKMTAVGDFAAS